MGMSPSVTSLFLFLWDSELFSVLPKYWSEYDYSFFDKYPAQIPVFSSCFYFAVNIENMIENHNTLINRKLCDCW